MRGKKLTAALLAAAILAGGLSGCGTDTSVYDQAVKDLEQGSYSYALEGFRESVSLEVKVTESYRGAGLVYLRTGDYENAAQCFTDALNSAAKLTDKMKKDLLAYRATAYLKSGQYELAREDCQTIAASYTMDGDTSFLSGCVALALDSYDEAASYFRSAYGQDTGYDMALRIYQEYLERGMEADGTYYLELALQNEPEDAEDYCSRGQVFYAMEDYEQARTELIEAQKLGSTQALLLLGMVYLAQGNTANARAVYQQFNAEDTTSAKGYNGLVLCDLEDGNYSSALRNIQAGIPYCSTEEMQSLLFNEIVVYEKMLEFEAAYQKAEEYCAMFPDDEAAARELRFLKTRQTSTQETTAEETTAE